jgi:hypothetical protein
MKKILLIFLLTFIADISSYAQDDEKKSYPDVSIGITATAGSFNATEKDVGIDQEPGFITGAGLCIEKMISDHISILSGLQYRYFYMDFKMEDEGESSDIRWTFQSINIPFLFIFFTGGDESSINLGLGIVYSHIFSSVMEADDGTNLDTKKDDAMKYTNANQIGFTAEIYFRIKATDFTDFIIGVTGEYYPTNLLYEREGSGDKLNMFNYNLKAGYMFRTGFFPGSSD